MLPRKQLFVKRLVESFQPLCCCCSVTKLCPTFLWPHFLRHTRLPCPSLSPWFAQTHVHWVGNAIQPSHPLSSPSPSVFNLSYHQGLFLSHFFTSDGQSIGASTSASVLPMNIQDWFPLRLTGLTSLQSKGHSTLQFCIVKHYITVQKHQFFGTQFPL